MGEMLRNESRCLAASAPDGFLSVFREELAYRVSAVPTGLVLSATHTQR
jgi:hypothetical protein